MRRRRTVFLAALVCAGASFGFVAHGAQAPMAAPAAAARDAVPASAAAPSTAITIPADADALLSLVLDLDRRMFAAYDAHDVDALMAWFASDLEFFHDTGGVANWTQVKTGFTSVFANNPDIRRVLVPGSTRVFPIKDYGAIQIGRHQFCHTDNGKSDCGTFEFVQVWRLRDGKWQVARELSYGH